MSVTLQERSYVMFDISSIPSIDGQLGDADALPHERLRLWNDS